MNNNEIMKKIRQYSDMNKLTFFVGAGVSKLSGFPSWFELVKSMGDELNYNYKKTYDIEGKEVINLSPDEFLKIPQMYYVEFGEDQYTEKVKRSFDNACKPNEIHDLIMSLHPNHILTTNYDTLIEETATKFGENYSLITSDKDISEAETIRYLLKVHGDFSTDFVLKESDYLNYEFKYQLITNLMKSIFATNLVVFIGYSLDDYNIKLILNWMQNVQKNQFLKPIFINTDSKKSETEKKYYLGRGICVFDSNDLCIQEESYLTKYRKVLDAIADFSPKPKLDNRCKVLEFLCGKVMEVGNLDYIKRSDFGKIFSNDFKINDEWEIEHLTHMSKMDNVWKDYFEYKDEYIAIDEGKCNKIDSFIQSCNIRGVHTDTGLYFPVIKISNSYFNNNYDEMITYCLVEHSDVKDQFRKAYYLSKIGKMAESYSLYTEVLKKSRQTKDWDIYYLSQINRYHLYRKINYARTYYAHPMTILSVGSRITIVDEEFFSQMSLEMSHCDISTQFNELPYFFKSKYKFLARFTEVNSFSDEINELMKNKYEIEKSLTANSMSMGMSKFDQIKLDMLEAIKFIENNMICVQEYEESKNYIKNAMLIWLGAYHKEVNRKSTDEFAHICNTRLKFELQDIILLSRSCKKEDIRYFEENIEFEELLFEQIEELKAYLLNLINFYKKKFKDEILMTEYLWWREICLEIQMIIYISSNYLKKESITLEIVEFILECNDGYWIYEDRVDTIRKYTTKDNATEILKVLEVHLIHKLKKYEKTNQTIYNHIRLLARKMAAISSVCTYDFSVLSNYISDNKDNIEPVASLLVALAPYLLTNSRKIILENYKIENVRDLIAKYKVDKTIDIDEYVYLIDDYFKKEIEEMNSPGITTHTIPPREEFIRYVSCFIIENDITMHTLREYKGYWLEFDYFFNTSNFEQDKFDVDWLLCYSDKILDYIKENEIRYSIVKKSLKSMDKSKCKENVERWIYLFGVFI